jgi:predicted nuclease of predicted toxin-antitoxin system
VKLLLDQNLPPRLVRTLGGRFPGSRHVQDVGLDEAADQEVWEFARINGFTIVTKDVDFRELSVLREASPEVIWIRRGNCPAHELERLFQDQAQPIRAFGPREDALILVLR